MKRGEGVYLFDESDRRYLDFAAGIAVNSLGHGHPAIVKALKEQADQLWHCSNYYRNEPLMRFSEQLVAQSEHLKSVFFCSSGVEAVEAGIKFIRKYFHATDKPERRRIITFEGAFHGRSIAALSAGGEGAFRDGYAPFLDGFDRVAFNDLSAVEAAITSETAAIMIEPVQGEGGVRPATPEFLQGLRHLCDRHGLLLFFDEVQCGYGRLGTLFAHTHFEVKPDIVSMAKGIGGGFPLGATMVTAEVATALTPGSHGSTYGSNPLAMAVGEAVLNEMLADGFMTHIQAMGAALTNAFQEIADEFPQEITAIRGIGLMIGLEVTQDARELAARLRDNGLLVAPAFGNVLRILPPLILQAEHIDEAALYLRRTIKGGQP